MKLVPGDEQSWGPLLKKVLHYTLHITFEKGNVFTLLDYSLETVTTLHYSLHYFCVEMQSLIFPLNIT